MQIRSTIFCEILTTDWVLLNPLQGWQAIDQRPQQRRESTVWGRVLVPHVHSHVEGLSDVTLTCDSLYGDERDQEAFQGHTACDQQIWD